MDSIPLLLDHCNIDDYNPCIFLSNMTALINAYLKYRESQRYYENLPILANSFCLLI